MNKFFKTAAAISVLLCFGAATSAYAAQAGADRNVKTLDQYTAAKLNSVQKEMDKKQYAEALADLKDLVGEVQDDPYALAVTERMIAYVYIGQKKYRPALPHFRKAVELNALPEQQQHDAVMTLAQLYALTEQYSKTIDLLEDWFKKEKNPPADAYLLAAKSYYQLKKPEPARKYIKLAIQKSDKPNEDWYGLLVGVDYQLKKYDEAIDVLKKMISYWPDEPDYWQNLYGLYLLQENNDKALVVMRVAYDKGMIDKGDALLNLARLELVHDLPYPAAEVLSKGMKSGQIKTNLENLRLLVTAWTQARETEQALETLDKAAKLSDDGMLYLKKAQLCYQEAEWDCTIEAAKNATDKGGLDEPGKAYIMKGMALAQLEQYDQAKEAFHKAESYKSTKEQAQGWIQYIKRTEAATS